MILKITPYINFQMAFKNRQTGREAQELMVSLDCTRKSSRWERKICSELKRMNICVSVKGLNIKQTGHVWLKNVNSQYMTNNEWTIVQSQPLTSTSSITMVWDKSNIINTSSFFPKQESIQFTFRCPCFTALLTCMLAHLNGQEQSLMI